MAVTAYKLAGTASSETRAGAGTDPQWDNPNNVKVDDANASFCLGEKNEYGHWLRVTNFSMGVPAGATINGIEVDIKRCTTVSPPVTIDSAVYLRKNAGQVGDNYASAETYPDCSITASEIYGGAVDLWNTAWSVADVNHTNFGLDISSLGDGEEAQANVYYIKIRVYYTEVPSVLGPFPTHFRI